MRPSLKKPAVTLRKASDLVTVIAASIVVVIANAVAAVIASDLVSVIASVARQSIEEPPWIASYVYAILAMT